MKRAHLLEPGRYAIEEVPAPEPGPGQVRVAVHVCGICGSDVHTFGGRHPFNRYPLVTGHEFSGTVDALGLGVEGWGVGQRVAVEPNLGCGECENCLAGRYNICDRLVMLGGQTSGAMAEFCLAPAEKLVAIPDAMTYEQAALIEPTAVGVHAVRRLDLASVERLLVIGAGTIGVQTMQAARALGVSEVVVTDLSPARLARALELGASHAVNVRETPLADWMRATYGQLNPMDAAIECVGAGEATVDGALEVLKKGRRLVVVGVWSTRPPVNLGLVQRYELELVGTCTYTRPDFGTARDMIAEGRIHADALITGRYTLDEVEQAVRAAATDPEHTLKVLLLIR